MRNILIVSFYFGLIVAAPQQYSKDAVIVKYENDNIGVDGYKFAVETSDGLQRSESGEIRNPGTENEALIVHGTISWIGEGGKTFKIDFVADENGFQPTGQHLPK